MPRQRSAINQTGRDLSSMLTHRTLQTLCTRALLCRNRRFERFSPIRPLCTYSMPASTQSRGLYPDRSATQVNPHWRSHSGSRSTFQLPVFTQCNSIPDPGLGAWAGLAAVSLLTTPPSVIDSMAAAAHGQQPSSTSTLNTIYQKTGSLRTAQLNAASRVLKRP